MCLIKEKNVSSNYFFKETFIDNLYNSLYIILFSYFIKFYFIIKKIKKNLLILKFLSKNYI